MLCQDLEFPSHIISQPTSLYGIYDALWVVRCTVNLRFCRIPESEGRPSTTTRMTDPGMTSGGNLSFTPANRCGGGKGLRPHVA